VEELGRQLQRLLRRTCRCEGPAVEYEGWYGTVHTFYFASEDYAAAFRRANAGKIVG
jgi:hypothetical protein